MSELTPVTVLTQEEYEAELQKHELEQMDATLRAIANKPRPYALSRQVNRKKVEQALHTAFEMIGGVPRLAMWADSNPTEFYKLYARLLPNESNVKHEGSVALKLVLKPNPLDD
jgi:hypothetical protein